jgi:hypothetical protein
MKTVFKYFLALLFLLQLKEVSGQVTQIWTDYNNALWTSSSSSLNSTKPDNSHNLLAFMYNGTIYSTGVNNALLNANTISYTTGSWIALPIGQLPTTSGSNYFVGLGQLYDGIHNGYNSLNPPFAGNPVNSTVLASFMTDGINGLNLGTGLANIPAGQVIRFNLSAQGIIPASINDLMPDVLFAQIASPNAVGDKLRFINSTGAIVGSQITFDLSNTASYPVVGNWTADFYNPNATGSGFLNTDRPMSFFAVKLSEFGITSSNYSQVVALEYETSGSSDPAFIAYNEPSIDIPNVKIISQPSYYTSGSVLSPAFQVALEDEGGNILAQSGVIITASLDSGPGSLTGTLTATTNASGIATFNNIIITAAQGGKHTIKFTNPNYVPAVSSYLNCSVVPTASSTITIVQSGGTSCGWSVSNNIISAQTSLSINVSEIENLLQDNNVTVSASGDIVLDATIDPALRATRTLTLKANGSIAFKQLSKISPTLSALNLLIWSDADASGSGDVFFEATSSYTNPVTILTNGGHLWIGGGSITSTWNGLVVGDGYATGGTLTRTVGVGNMHTNGITIQATDIQTSGGHILMRGKSASGNSPTNFSGGVYLLGNGSMNSGGGNIEIEAVAQSGTGRKYGLYNFGAYTFSPGQGNLTINGDASFVSDPDNASFSGRGVFLWSSVTAINSTGNISIIGRGSTSSNPGIDIRTPITAGGSISYEAENIYFGANHSAGGNIIIKSNQFSFGTNNILATSSQLQVAPLTANADIGIAGAAGTLQIPATYFSLHFADGFSRIQIGSDNQSGNINMGALTLRDHLSIKTSGVFTLSGPVVLGNNDILLDSRITSVAGVSQAVYFQTNGIGKIRRNITGGGSFIYPIGVSLTVNSNQILVYLPVTLQNHEANAREYYLTVSNGVFTNGQTSGVAVSSVNPRINMTWNIGNDVGSVAAPGLDINVSWNPTLTQQSYFSSGTLTNPTLFHHDGTVWNQLTGTPSYNAAAGTFSYTGYVGSFSPFAISETGGTLPVTWQSLTAEKQGAVSLLKWSTASEQNTKDFEVQHSTNTVTWTPLGTVMAAGNSTITKKYSFIHNTPFKGGVYNYYRIMQRDLDGKFSYSKIASLIYDESGGDVLVYPNPAAESLTIYIAESKEVKLINVGGAIIWSGTLQAGRNNINVKPYAKGIYWVVAGSIKKQIIIQ